MRTSHIKVGCGCLVKPSQNSKISVWLLQGAKSRYRLARIRLIDFPANQHKGRRKPPRRPSGQNLGFTDVQPTSNSINNLITYPFDSSLPLVNMA